MNSASEHTEPVVIAPYDDRWPRMYEEECFQIATLFGALAVGIEHIGSTSVPGLAAKPIIDILVGVERLGDATRYAALASLGYRHMAELSVGDRCFFRKGNPITHHVHVVAINSSVWSANIMFRDYLRQHKDAACAYEALKRELAYQFADNRLRYTASKGPFIAEVLKKAATGEKDPTRTF